jgi:hypothetical protein
MENDKPTRKTASSKITQEEEYTERLLAQARLQSIKPGSKQMEALLAVGYPEIGTREHALEILKSRKENPMYYPWEMEQKARAFLEALDARPK